MVAMSVNKNLFTLLPSVFLGGNSKVPASGITLRILGEIKHIVNKFQMPKQSFYLLVEFIKFRITSVDIPFLLVYSNVYLVDMVRVCTTASLYDRWDGNMDQWLILFTGKRRIPLECVCSIWFTHNERLMVLVSDGGTPVREIPLLWSCWDNRCTMASFSASSRCNLSFISISSPYISAIY